MDLLSPGLVPMHGIASRHDLPLPFEYVVVGASVALIVSFVLMFFGWPNRRYTTPGGINLYRPPVWLEWAGRVVVLALYVLVLAALVAGEDRITNPVFGFIYVWIWVGLVILAALFGQFWIRLNPIRTVHTLVCRVLRRDPHEGVFELPRKLGVWPAAIGLFLFAYLELVQDARTTLPVIIFYVALWATSLLIGLVLFGQKWVAAADPFEVYATTVASGAPIQRQSGKHVQVMNPLRGLALWRPPSGTPAVIAVLLGSTAFDSFANTSWWIGTVQDSNLPYAVWGTSGLLIMIGIVGGTFFAGTVLMKPFAKIGVDTKELPRLMSPSVVPILVGYAIAHYLTMLLIEGQRTMINLSDPLGRGWNLFGTAELGVNTTLVENPTPIAIMQGVAIVTGHIVGIVVAHERSLALLRSDRKVRGQIPLLVVMIGYTIAGLLLLFSP